MDWEIKYGTEFTGEVRDDGSRVVIQRRTTPDGVVSEVRILVGNLGELFTAYSKRK